MRLYLTISVAELKVVSAVFSNLVVVWLVAIFGAQDPLVLTRNILAGILSLYLAVKAEEKIRKIK